MITPIRLRVRFSALRRVLFTLSMAALMVGLAFTPVMAAVNELVWKKFSGVRDEAPLSMAADKNGNLVVATEDTSESAGYIRKRSGGGRVLWTRKHTVSGYSTWITDVAVDSDSYIYVVGSEQSYGRAFISKYGPKGGHHWTRQFPRESDARIMAVDVGPGGNIYVFGETYEPLPNMAESSAGFDAFIRKYNPNGKIFWTRQFNLGDYEGGSGAFDIAVGPGGGVYVLGYSYFGLDDVVDVFLRKYSPRGGIYWTRQVRREVFAYGGSMAVDRAGDVVMAIDDEESGTLAVKYSHKGSLLWTRQWFWHMPEAVVVDRDRSLYIVGTDMGEKASVRKYQADGKILWTRDFVNGWPTAATTDADNNLFITGVQFSEDYQRSPFLVKFRR